MNPGAEKGYALDFLSVVRHVATELEGARPGALSGSELAADYRHPNTGDLARVRKHHELASDQAAVEFLIERAVGTLANTARDGKGTIQIESNGIGYRLVVPFEELRYERRKLHRIHDPHARLRDPFNPMTGAFSEAFGIESARLDARAGSLDELRESMRTFGWIEQLPAWKDERGVVLVGHRRMALAAELEIEPVVKTIRLGDGDESDAKRFALALASNLGAKPFTKEERKRIAEYLHGERDWTIERIAQALGVGKSTVGRDVSEFPTMGKSGRRHGRPRTKLTKAEIEYITKNYQEFNGTKTVDDLCEELGGMSHAPVLKAIDQERGRRQERERAEKDPKEGHREEKGASRPQRETPASDDTPAEVCPCCGRPLPSA